MRLAERFNKPEYLYRPRQALRRLAQAVLPEPEIADVLLPWGLRIRARPGEDLGRAIWRLGVYDLTLSEAIWRLLEPGEIAIDVGANIGYVTGLMAARSGSTGCVVSFEPHPKVFAELISNIESWRTQPIAHITAMELALSSKSGFACIEEPSDFQRNPGTARVVTDQVSHVQISTARLDDIPLNSGKIDLLKLDVEGHELEVLLGGRKLLETGIIRDIIFEEHSRSFTSPVASLLESFGYVICLLTRTFTGPLFVTKQKQYPLISYVPPNFLATRRLDRAVARFKSVGWHVLRPKVVRS